MNHKLDAKIAARNHVNALANDRLPKIREAVKPFLGKKVALQGGGMTAKLDAALSIFRATNLTDQVWFNARTYTLEATFKTCFKVQGENGCVYAERAVTFAELERDSNNLKQLYTTTTFRTDYTVQEIEIARKAVTVARDAMRAAEWQLVGFGEHDNG